jgi:IS5 family transposase
VQLWLFYRVLGQRRDSHNKTYSFHAPEVSCISKGKDHKKYEFGNKSGFVITKNSGIILGAMVFEGNPYDGHTLEPHLEQISGLVGRLPKVALVDRGYKGRKAILEVEIMMPSSGKSRTAYEKNKNRARFRRRAAVEPVIGHLKSDYRMLRNYLKGVEGDMINTIMAAVAYNMMKRLRHIRDAIYFVLDLLIGIRSIRYAALHNY